MKGWIRADWKTMVCWRLKEPRLLAEILTIILDDSEPWKEELPKNLKLPPVFHLGYLPLLHAISKSFPSNPDPYSDHVDVACFCGKTHRVSPFGFILLEDTEAILDQKEMSMRLVVDRVRIQVVRFPNPLATGHSWQLGNLTRVLHSPPSKTTSADKDWKLSLKVGQLYDQLRSQFTG